MVDNEPLVTLHDYLKDLVQYEDIYHQIHAKTSPLRLTTSQSALAWIGQCPSAIQSMNVASYVSYDGHLNFKALLDHLGTLPADRYTDLLKTNLELLSLLK